MTDAAFWDKIAPRYAARPLDDPEGYEETLERIAAQLRPEHRVLEVGCGTGSTALRLAPGVAEYLGTDVSPAMIGIARAKGGPETLRFEVAQAGDAPWPPYDAVLALNLLHLLPDLETDLARLARAIPSGGLLISKTPLLDGLRWYMKIALRAMQLVGKAPDIRRVDEAGLIALMEANGFDVIERFVQSGDMAPRAFIVARKR